MPRFGDLSPPRERLATNGVLRSDASGRIDAACRLAVAGKLALRDIAAWVHRFGVSETEFRLLWLLFQHEHDERGATSAFDQAEVAERLVVSAAQVSGVVERLKQHDLVDRVLDGGDRRRQLWRLTPAGEALVLEIVASVAAMKIPPLAPPFKGGGYELEDAA